MLEVKNAWKAIMAVITLRKASLIMEIRSSISVNIVQINNFSLIFSPWICASCQVILCAYMYTMFVLKWQLQNKKILIASQWKKFSKYISFTHSYIEKNNNLLTFAKSYAYNQDGTIMANSGYLPKFKFCYFKHFFIFW